MPSRQPPPPTAAVEAADAVAPPPESTTLLRHRAQHPHPNHLRHLLPVAAAAAAAATLFVLAAAFFLGLLLYRRLSRGGTAPTVPSPSQPPPTAAALRRLSYAALRRATGGFAPELKLGQGGFGPVFRGALPSGDAVAVKLMDATGSLQGEREFHNELALGSHLLPSPSPCILLPFAFSVSSSRDLLPWWRRLRLRRGGDDDGDEEAARRRRRRMMLVYELMPNGSLQDALLGRRSPELVAEWRRRFAVALDVARALHFLHAVCDPPVVHGDVKPSNVLLDARLSARLADFGLARLNPPPPPPPPRTRRTATPRSQRRMRPRGRRRRGIGGRSPRGPRTKHPSRATRPRRAPAPPPPPASRRRRHRRGRRRWTRTPLRHPPWRRPRRPGLIGPASIAGAA